MQKLPSSQDIELLRNALHFHERGNCKEAWHIYQGLLESYPEQPDILQLAGALCRDIGARDEAVRLMQKSLAMQPDQPQVHNNLGNTLTDLQQYDAALEQYNRAIALDPNYAIAYFNYATTQWMVGRYEDAVQSLGKAIVLKSDYMEAFCNRGLMFVILERYREARQDFDAALALNPNFPDANFYKSLLLLRLGEYQQGWQLYEWRQQLPNIKPFFEQFNQPMWMGDGDLHGKTILIQSEQGLGDMIQMLRYIPMLRERCDSVILELPDTVAALYSKDVECCQVIRRGEPLPQFDVHCPLMSLPLAFKTEISTIPNATPYLKVSEEKKHLWATRLGPHKKLRVGLAWSGSNNEPKYHLNRSIPLRLLLPLLELDVDFISLQKEYGDNDLELMKTTPLIKNFSKELQDLSDTAALIENLDLVISIDTAVAHLAGALHKSCWILLTSSADHRWLIERSDSPWYHSVRLFRQSVRSAWESVMDQVKGELLKFVLSQSFF